MKCIRQLAGSVALLLAVAAAGCAAGNAPDEGQHDAAPQRDGQFDATNQPDGLTQDDAGNPQDGGAQHDGGGDANVTVRTITGTSIAHHLWDNGNADVPDDLSAAEIAALVLNGTSYTTYGGSGDATGHFTIANVPTGPYLLFVDGWYFRMTTDTPSLDYYVRGRAAIASATTTTNLVFNVTNLSSYQQNSDDVIYYSSNTDAWDDIAYAGTQLASGATTVAKSYDLNGANASKTLATTDDHPILIDYVGSSTATYLVSTAKRSFSPTPYSQTDGQSVNVSGAFANIATTNNVSVNWLRSEFRGGTVIADIGPGATFKANSQYQLLYAVPGGLTHGVYCGGVELAQLFTDDNTGNINFGSLSYGNPFDSSWGQYLFTGVAATLSITAPGATTAATVTGWVTTAEAKASSMTSHLIISPPRALKINNQAATTNLTAVTTTPTLSWSAPTTGTANTYQVFVWEVANSSGTTTRAGVAAFYTDQTSLVVPDGILTAGKSYQLRVMAISDPNASYATAPWVTSLPYGDATAFTALVSP